jgi:hypothetical protein
MVNGADSISTDLWVEAHILSAKLYFRMYKQSSLNAQDRVLAKQFFVKSIGTLLKIKSLLPPIDLKTPSLKLPVSI